MASGPITSWQIDGETVETVSDFILGGGSKITEDGDCSHEIKGRLLLGRKVMTNLDSIFKSRDITLPRVWFFQWSCMEVRVGLWRKLSAEELMLVNCGAGEDSWEPHGLLGDPISQSLLLQISPEYSLERLMLKLHYFGHLMQRADSLEKNLNWETLRAGGYRKWDGWMASLTQWT